MHRLNYLNRAFSLVVVAGMVVLAGCGGSSSSSSSSSSSKTTAKATSNLLRWGQNWGDVWVKSMDPAIITDTLSINMVYLVQANLVKLDYPSLKPIPDLATWTVSPNHLVWTFHIRPNAKFSNGDPVTAQDAAWSITRALTPSEKSPVATTYLGDVVGATAVNSGKAKTVSGLKVVNSKTLQITLDKPIAYFLGTLSYPTADVLDQKVVQGKTSAQMTNQCTANAGAGPFKLVCLNSSNGKGSFYPSGHSPFMKFKPNPFYYGKKPTITIQAPFFSTSDTAFKAYQAGELDFTPVPSGDLSIAQKKKGFTKAAELATDYITPNQKTAPFTNINCRLAFAYAIDRVDITDKLLKGTEGPTYAIVPPGLPSYINGHPGVPYYNPTLAKQYYAKCPGGIHVNMPFQNTSPDVAHEYDAIKANVAAIGGSVNLQPKTFNAWLTVVTQNLNATKTQITENLWLDDYPDPQDWLDNLLHTGRNYNIGNFNNPQYDKLVDQGNVEFDPTKRAQLYTQAQKIALNNGAWIAVGYPYAIYVVNPRVHGMINSNAYIWPMHNDWSKVSISGS